ncbi:alpha/beta hydrolase [Micromonospora taraxaci]|uniref:alpha/beta fold hydrolase n=1 Tax=Micromonospora taraxaci TaxID=1316803 RepID=UPI00340EB465
MPSARVARGFVVRPELTHEVRVDGLPLVCHVRGRGPVCVVHSGGPGTHGEHLRIPLAERELTMVYVEPAGTGTSAVLGADATHDLSSRVAHLHAVIRTFGAEPVFVLGRAHGGVVCQAYALRHPDQVAGLILCSTSPIADARASAATREMSRQCTVDISGAAVDARDALPSITTPTLIMTGLRDVDSAADSAALRQGNPGAQLATFRGSAHLAHLEEPERFAHLLLEFTRRISGPVRTAQV